MVASTDMNIRARSQDELGISQPTDSAIQRLSGNDHSSDTAKNRYHRSNTMEKLPHISTVSTLSAPDRSDILDRLFEPCVPLHTLSLELLHTNTFQDYDEMVASIGAQLSALAESTSTSDTKWLESILAAHPRLGDKADSAQSSGEQAHLNVKEGDDGPSLSELNALYDHKFPGLRYV